MKKIEAKCHRSW